MEIEEEEEVLLRKRKNTEESSDEDELVDIMDESPIDKKPKPRYDMHNIITNPNVPPDKCPICFDPLICTCCYHENNNSASNVCKLSNCGHSYCKPCMSKYFTLHIKEKRFPIKCPNPSCKKEIGYNDIENELPKEYVNNFDRFQLERVIQQNPEVYSCCPTPDCGYYFVWSEGDDPHFRCEKCKRRYCLTCKTDYHTGRSCLQFQRFARENGMSEQLFKIFVQGQKFKMCPKCKAWVEKTFGCDTIYCSCGHSFCYRCGTSICICWAQPPPERVVDAFAFLRNNNNDEDDDE